MAELATTRSPPPLILRMPLPDTVPFKVIVFPAVGENAITCVARVPVFTELFRETLALLPVAKPTLLLALAAVIVPLPRPFAAFTKTPPAVRVSPPEKPFMPVRLTSPSLVLNTAPVPVIFAATVAPVLANLLSIVKLVVVATAETAANDWADAVKVVELTIFPL